MKIWLTRHRQLLALGIVAATLAVFALGWHAGTNASTRKAYAMLWEAIVGLPDPEQCSLCSKGIRYHAPCLINLSTGQMGEMKVYTNHPSKQGEIASMENQETSTLNFHACAGLIGIRDTCNHAYQVTLPAVKELMNPALYCRECRQLLAGAGLEGYVIVDLYDFQNVQAYPVRDNEIRNYRVSVVKGQERTLNLCVQGLLEY